MGALADVYRERLGLLTDLYQLTMAHGYWRHGIDQRRAVFHLSYRKNPFGGGYTIACGQQAAADYLSGLTLSAEDVRFLESLTGADQQPLFEREFLDFLSRFKFTADVDAVPEGTVVFPYQPLLRVTGPLWQCQLVETALLNRINFETLIATKASRMAWAAAPGEVLEFGLRRAQGFDGGLTASRAAYVGGCAATSNVLAGKLYGIPVRGTHAHSWVMSFAAEREAFEAYGRAQPNNAVFLVDTYDTEQGVVNAIAVAREMRARGHEMIGIRLDSGDLAELSRRARRQLDEAGFASAKIVASNDLDEHEIVQLKSRGACIDLWGVGTRLATAYDQPALGGVFKLAAYQDEQQAWQRCVKRSEVAAKSSDPGLLQIRRFWRGDRLVRDTVYDVEVGEPSCTAANDRGTGGRLPDESFDRSEDLLRPLLRQGKRLTAADSIDVSRQRARQQLAALDPALRELQPSIEYVVGLEPRLSQLRSRLIAQAEVTK